MLNKDSVEYKLRKQKRIDHLRDEIRDKRKDCIKGTSFAICLLILIIFGRFKFNIFLVAILSTIVVSPIAYLFYKRKIYKYKKDLNRLLDDKDDYFGCDEFYD